MSEQLIFPWWCFTERMMERYEVRRGWHRESWHSCRGTFRGVCLRCCWRDLTGQTHRAKAEFVTSLRAQRDHGPAHIHYVQRTPEESP